MMVYSSIRAISGRIAVPQFIAESLEAMSLAEEADDDALVVGLTTAPVFALWNAGRYREAIKLAERAIELTKGDPTFGAGISIGSPLAFQTMWKAVCLTQLGELDEAISLLSKALEIARAQGDLETMDWCYEMRVWHAYCSGDSSTALADGKQCFEIGERIGDGFTRSWARYWLAAAYYLEEDWERCIELSEESERMSQEMGTAVLGRPPRLAQMALALSAVGRAEEGIPHAKEAIRSAEEQGVTTGLAFGLVALARCLRLARGEAAADEAAQLLDRAIESIKETEFRGYQPQVHEELAEIQRMRGDEDAYEAELRQALSIAEEIGASAHAARYAEALGASGAPAP
jgi:tetratricopeptide (TPR) repeat protein